MSFDPANPNVTRSRLVLEIASEMAGSAAGNVVPAYVQPRVVMRNTRGGKAATFLGVSTAEGIFAVARREVDLAMINPAAVLSVAMRGKGIFKEPMPVRAIAVIPSPDQFVFAVRPETGLSSLEDIARRKPKLRILMRGMVDHTLHHMFDDIAAAAGFSRDDIKNWGGEVRKAGSVPWTNTETFKSLIRGDVDAIFDEAANYWLPQALDAGIKILALAEETVVTLGGDGLSPRDTAEVDLSQAAAGRPVLGFQRLDRLCSCRSRRRSGDTDLRWIGRAQITHSLGGARRSARRADGARSARHTADCAAPSGGRALLAQPWVHLSGEARPPVLLPITPRRCRAPASTRRAASSCRPCR